MSLTRKHLFDLPLAALALATVGYGYQGGCEVEKRIAISIDPRCNSQRSLAKGAKPSHFLNRTQFVAKWNEQSNLLDGIKDHIASSLAIDSEDFSDIPFNQLGGLGRAYELFGDSLTSILEELNARLAA